MTNTAFMAKKYLSMHEHLTEMAEGRSVKWF